MSSFRACILFTFLQPFVTRSSAQAGITGQPVGSCNASTGYFPDSIQVGDIGFAVGIGFYAAAHIVGCRGNRYTRYIPVSLAYFAKCGNSPKFTVNSTLKSNHIWGTWASFMYWKIVRLTISRGARLSSGCHTMHEAVHIHIPEYSAHTPECFCYQEIF